MVKSAVRRRRLEEQVLLLPPPPSLLALGSEEDGTTDEAAPFWSSTTDPNASLANEQDDSSTTMAPSVRINDAHDAAPADGVDGVVLTAADPPPPADETSNWEEEGTATAYLDETELAEGETAASSEAPAISDPDVEQDQEGDSSAWGATSTETIDAVGTFIPTITATTIPAEQQAVPTATIVPNTEKVPPVTPPTTYQNPAGATEDAAATADPPPNTGPALNTTAWGALGALIFVFLVWFCCRRRRRDGWDTSRGQYRAVANQYSSNQYDDAFADDLSDYDDNDIDDDDDGEVLDDGSSYNGNGKMTIELKEMKKDRGRLSLQEMNG